MSLVPSFTYCDNGKWYKNLVYRDKDENWFICFDDRDPVELVVRQDAEIHPRELLDTLGIPYNHFTGKGRRSDRIFSRGPYFSEGMNFHPAIAYFLDVRNEPFPAPDEHATWAEEYDEKPDSEGVYYGFDFYKREDK